MLPHLLLLLPHLHRHAVDFHVVLNGNYKAAASTDELGFYEIETVRVDLDIHIRCLHGKFSGSGDGRDEDRGVIPGGFLVDFIKVLQALRFYAALFQEILDFRFCEGQRNLVLFMFLRKLREILMDLADSLIVAVLAQRIGQDLLNASFWDLKEIGVGAPRQASMNSEWSSSGFFEKYRML